MQRYNESEEDANKKCRNREIPALFRDPGISVYRYLVMRDDVITTLRRLFYSCTLGVEEFVATLDEELAVMEELG